MTTQPTQEVFELVLARFANDGVTVHLWWRAPQQGNRLVQIYIDGQLVDVTHDMTQRQAWLVVDRSNAHRIELLAVPTETPNMIWQPMPMYLTSWNPPVQSEVELQLVRDETLPVDAHFAITVDGAPTYREPIWPTDEHRGGFGAIFGVGGFGDDAATGLGLGEGQLGAGPLGADGTAWRLRVDDLTTGSYDLGVTGVTNTDEPIALEHELSDVSIDHLPVPADNLTVSPSFVLSWNQ